MTGPEHYKQAERLIAGVTLSGTHPDGSPIIRSDEPQTIALAQVHATLALAAAYAMPNAGRMDIHDCQAWEDVAGGEAALQRRLEASDPELTKLMGEVKP